MCVCVLCTSVKGRGRPGLAGLCVWCTFTQHNIDRCVVWLHVRAHPGWFWCVRCREGHQGFFLCLRPVGAVVFYVQRAFFAWNTHATHSFVWMAVGRGVIVRCGTCGHFMLHHRVVFVNLAE